MKLNVLLYGSTPNPQGIPVDWPAQIMEVADNAPPPASPWIEMTKAAYADYIAARQAEYDAWKAAQTAAKDSAIATLANQYDAGLTALQNFAAIGSPTQAQTLNAVQTHNTILIKLLPLLRKMYLDSIP